MLWSFCYLCFLSCDRLSCTRGRVSPKAETFGRPGHYVCFISVADDQKVHTLTVCVNICSTIGSVPSSFRIFPFYELLTGLYCGLFRQRDGVELLSTLYYQNISCYGNRRPQTQKCISKPELKKDT